MFNFILDIVGIEVVWIIFIIWGSFSGFGLYDFWKYDFDVVISYNVVLLLYIFVNIYK